MSDTISSFGCFVEDRKKARVFVEGREVENITDKITQKSERF